MLKLQFQSTLLPPFIVLEDINRSSQYMENILKLVFGQLKYSDNTENSFSSVFVQIKKSLYQIVKVISWVKCTIFYHELSVQKFILIQYTHTKKNLTFFAVHFFLIYVFCKENINFLLLILAFTFLQIHFSPFRRLCITKLSYVTLKVEISY